MHRAGPGNAAAPRDHCSHDRSGSAVRPAAAERDRRRSSFGCWYVHHSFASSFSLWLMRLVKQDREASLEASTRDQYSLGKSTVVAERSASVMIHNFCCSFVW